MPIIHEPPRPVVTTSPLGGIPRHAEFSDTRMGIRHDEEKQDGKKKDHQPSPPSLPEDVYDQTTLGVRALIDFLQKFLQTLPTSPTLPVTNPTAAHAAQAYGRTAHTRTDYNAHGPAVEPEPAVDLLHTSEIRQIHELLTRLHTLDRAGIAGLKLSKAESFVQSLINAADSALAEVHL